MVRSSVQSWMVRLRFAVEMPAIFLQDIHVQTGNCPRSLHLRLPSLLPQHHLFQGTLRHLVLWASLEPRNFFRARHTATIFYLHVMLLPKPS